MNSQFSLNEQKMQEREAIIKEIEHKYGITTRSNEQSMNEQQANNEQESGKPQPKITREEYEVIKSVFKRIGCDSLITYSGFFGNFVGYSYSGFFCYQPKAVQALCYYMSQIADNSERQQICSYINNLEIISESLCILTENNAIFEEAEKLCNALDEAHTQYQ